MDNEADGDDLNLEKIVGTWNTNGNGDGDDGDVSVGVGISNLSEFTNHRDHAARIIQHAWKVYTLRTTHQYNPTDVDEYSGWDDHRSDVRVKLELDDDVPIRNPVEDVVVPDRYSVLNVFKRKLGMGADHTTTTTTTTSNPNQNSRGLESDTRVDVSMSLVEEEEGGVGVDDLMDEEIEVYEDESETFGGGGGGVGVGGEMSPVSPLRSDVDDVDEYSRSVGSSRREGRTPTPPKYDGREREGSGGGSGSGYTRYENVNGNGNGNGHGHGHGYGNGHQEDKQRYMRAEGRLSPRSLSTKYVSCVFPQYLSSHPFIHRPFLRVTLRKKST